MSTTDPSPLRLVLSLALAGLVSGLVLVGIYLGTLPLIRENQAAALEQAIFSVLPQAESFQALQARDGALVPYEGPAAKAPVGEVVYAARDGEERIVGYAIPAEGAGFQDTIVLLYGFDADRRVVVGLEILESRETPGLGDKIITDEDFNADFQALAVEPEIVPITRGEPTKPNQVDCITGATISSKAVVSIINRSMEHWLPILRDAEARVAMGGPR